MVNAYASLWNFGLEITSRCDASNTELAHELSIFLKQRLDDPLDIALGEVCAWYLNTDDIRVHNSMAYSELAKAFFR